MAIVETSSDNSVNTQSYIDTNFVSMKNQVNRVFTDDVCIFKSDKHCIIDSILIFNVCDILINLNVYMKNTDDEKVTIFDMLRNVEMKARDSIEMLQKSIFYFGVGDELYASVSDSSGIATLIVSYRELNNHK